MHFSSVFAEFKTRVAVILSLIWLLAIWNFQSLNTVIYPLLSVVLMTVLDLGITFLRSKKLYWPSASFVTGLLIGLIIDPSEPWYVFALAVLAAFISKQFIGSGLRQHIFNPAALGIMTVSLTLGIPVAWWGVAWGQLPLVILIPGMIYVLYTMKRIFIPITFLLVYFTYYLFFFSPQGIVSLLLDGSFMLFVLVMLPEPITSPVIGKLKFIFGATVAVVAIGFSYLGSIAEIFLPALLVCDLGFFIYKKIARQKTKVSAAV